MPPDAGQRDGDVELVELRILDGPNRFFTRPAVKLEFAGTEPGRAAEVAASAAHAVKRLTVALELPEPRMTMRHSVDRLRTAFAFPWRRRTISQAIGAAAARVALGRSTDRRELAGLRATALGPLPHLPKARIPIVAITGTNGKSTTTRLITHIASEAGLKVGMTNSDGIYVRDELVEAGDWTGFGGAARVLAEPGLDLAVLETARGGILLRGIGYAPERRQRGDERDRRSPRPAGDRYGRRAGRGEGRDRSHHEARRVGRAQRRRRPRLGDAAPHASAHLRLQPRAALEPSGARAGRGRSRGGARGRGARPAWCRTAAAAPW